MSRFDRALAMAAFLVVLIGSMGFTIYTNHQARARAEENNKRSEARQCELIGVEVRFFQVNPPAANDLGRTQRAKDYQDLWNRHCADKP